MTTLIINRTEVVVLATDPNWRIPEFVKVAGINYETRAKVTEGDITTYTLTDSGVNQE